VPLIDTATRRFERNKGSENGTLTYPSSFAVACCIAVRDDVAFETSARPTVALDTRPPTASCRCVPMFYKPEPSRGWDVLPAYDGDATLMRVLSMMMKDAEAPGHSDVGIQNLLYSEILNSRPRRVLEIGTHIGTASVIMGRALARNGYGKLFTLEPQAHYQQVASGYIDAAEVAPWVEIVPMFSYQPECEKRLAEEAPFDLIFIDGAHEYEAALHDIRFCYGLLRENGLMILHDVGRLSPDLDQSARGGARRALYDFTSEMSGARTIFREHPLWLNHCGAALVCKQALEPAP
jgi:predicted O-methyltransferase YrrM